MKKIVLAIAALVAALGASTAFAQQAYVGGAVGQAHANADCSGTTECSVNSTGFKLFGGYKFTPNLAGEVTYFDFGRIKAGVPTSIGTVDVKIKGTGLGLGVAYSADFAPQWSGTGRLGVAFNHTAVDAASGGVTASDSENSTNPYVGVGVSYEIQKGLKLDAGLDFSRFKYSGESANVRLLSVGVNYAF
jgi:OOP family OmpA-OmpF porin